MVLYVLAVVVWGSLLSSAFFFGRPKFAACNINPTLCQITSPYIPRPNVPKAADSDIAIAKSLEGIWVFNTGYYCDNKKPERRYRDIEIFYLGNNRIEAKNIEDSTCFKGGTQHFTGFVSDRRVVVFLHTKPNSNSQEPDQINRLSLDFEVNSGILRYNSTNFYKRKLG